MNRKILAKLDTKTSFFMGFNYGRTFGIELSAKQIESRWSDVDTTAFVQGMLDGIVGDRFRVNLAKG